MICPNCKANNDKVIDTRYKDYKKIVRRRRECKNCGARYFTIEAVVQSTLDLADDRKTAYSRKKTEDGTDLNFEQMLQIEMDEIDYQIKREEKEEKWKRK